MPAASTVTLVPATLHLEAVPVHPVAPVAGHLVCRVRPRPSVLHLRRTGRYLALLVALVQVIVKLAELAT